jgi:Flp pilus assembly pilin Flp
MLQAWRCSDHGKGYAAVSFRGLKSMQSFLRRLSGDQCAVTTIEYSLIVCLISTAAIGALTTVGQSMLNFLGNTANALH